MANLPIFWRLETALLALAALLALLGLLGSFLPVLPGPPLSFLALGILWFSNTHQPDTQTLGWYFAGAAAITVLDYLVPIWGAKFFGGSKNGTFGATAGLLVGLFLGPVGIIFGPFVGALLGEMIGGRATNEAFRAAIGAFLGFLAGVALKLAYGALVVYELIQLL